MVTRLHDYEGLFRKEMDDIIVPVLPSRMGRRTDKQLRDVTRLTAELKTQLSVAEVK